MKKISVLVMSVLFFSNFLMAADEADTNRRLIEIKHQKAALLIKMGYLYSDEARHLALKDTPGMQISSSSAVRVKEGLKYTSSVIEQLRQGFRELTAEELELEASYY